MTVLAADSNAVGAGILHHGDDLAEGRERAAQLKAHLAVLAGEDPEAGGN